MTKINNTIIAKELNDNCLNRDHNLFHEWETDDIDVKNYLTRNYCLVDVKYNILCEKCSKILSMYRDLYKIIVKTELDIETFNGIVYLRLMYFLLYIKVNS